MRSVAAPERGVSEDEWAQAIEKPTFPPASSAVVASAARLPALATQKHHHAAAKPDRCALLSGSAAKLAA
jgi:hypothetical protein